jgi:hypothetical protein
LKQRGQHGQVRTDIVATFDRSGQHATNLRLVARKILQDARPLLTNRLVDALVLQRLIIRDAASY